MLVLRIVGFLILITVGSSLVVYVFTRNRRYIAFARQLLKYGGVLLGLVLVFMLLERVVLVI